MNFLPIGVIDVFIIIVVTIILVAILVIIFNEVQKYVQKTT